MKRFVIVIAVCLLSVSVDLAQVAAPYELGGAVGVLSGAAVPGAKVTLSGDGFQRGQTTDAQGHFRFGNVPVSAAVVKVNAVGFAAAERHWVAQSQGASPLDIIMTPAPLAERIVVAATLTPQRVSETAESTAALAHEDLSSTAALTLDGALRQVPGIVLLRRTGSLAAVENLLDQRCDVARTHVLTFGPPPFVRVGLRFHLR